MIPIENLCITLEQAKKIKELGVEQDSHFYWINCYSNAPINKWKIVSKNEKDKYGCMCVSYSAFTIGEIVFIASTSDFDISNDLEDLEYVIKNLNGLPIVNEIIKSGKH